VFSRSSVTAIEITSASSVEHVVHEVVGHRASVGAFWSLTRIAAASGWPIQIGRN
jgi:hypothetical protein